MNAVMSHAFDQTGLPDLLTEFCIDELDELDFGVIGFDAAGIVRAYNACESKYAGLSPARVLGQPLFSVVAPCMNNFMVAQRFEDAAADGTLLDSTIDYLLTLRMPAGQGATSSGGQSWRRTTLCARAPAGLKSQYAGGHRY